MLEVDPCMRARFSGLVNSLSSSAKSPYRLWWVGGRLEEKRTCKKEEKDERCVMQVWGVRVEKKVIHTLHSKSCNSTDYSASPPVPDPDPKPSPAQIYILDEVWERD